eukprot:TRINITY_DN15443_c0_g1_i1.p2 TRINITY_DN15443_c0_g1~~TRINITY_DN15443_c0_g1_i1.p2  ORF type:complete len:355 (+),score=80.24 TRINITY_DN15443_c0_g1_i1:103-1167(+)
MSKADRDALSDDELSEEGEVKDVEKPPVDYEAIDEESGFKQVEWQVWQAYSEAILAKPEDEREDRDEWSETYATEHNVDKNRVTTVIRLGIYAGARDEFNQRAGEGKAIYSNGDSYEGHYWEGKKNGKGIYVYKSLGMSEVDRLLGDLVKARPPPEEEDEEAFIARAASTLKVGREVVAGHLRYGPFPCFHGDYINNLRHGHGVMRNRDGSLYQGYWKDNKRHGEGMFFYLNGDVYSGQWEEGLKHGAGCYTYANGVGHYTGIWQKGVFTEGQWHMTDGIFYEGKFDAKNRPCDPVGAIKFPQVEVVQTGDYKKGVWAPTRDLIRFADYVPPLPEGTAEGEGEGEAVAEAAPTA